MSQHKIDCVSKPNRYSPHEHITYIGSTTEGKAWTRDQAIKAIESGNDTFYVKVGNDFSWVKVVYPTDGRHSYLRTRADGKWDDNLLSLNDCVLA